MSFSKGKVWNEMNYFGIFLSFSCLKVLMERMKKPFSCLKVQVRGNEMSINEH